MHVEWQMEIKEIPNKKDQMGTRIAFLLFTFSVLIQDSAFVTGKEDILYIAPTAPVVSVGQAVELVCDAHCPNSKPSWEKAIDSMPGKITHSPSKTVLRIDKVLESYENNYRCTTMCRGKFYSKDVYLAVYSFPHHPKVELQSLNPMDGQTVTLRCSAQNLYPCHTVEVFWYRNREFFSAEKPAVMRYDHLCHTVSHQNYTTASADRNITFTCEIRLGLSAARFRSKNSTLEVHLNSGLYNVWIEPAHTVGRAGRPLSLSCGADSSNVPTITWRKASTDSTAPSHWNISQKTRYSTLHIEKLEPEDRGAYICEISDGESHTQRLSSVEVWYGPRNVSIEGGGSARERETLALTCQGDANPEANITWRRETGSEQPRWNISTSRGKSELRIDSLSPDDHGLYECVVENPLGAVRLEAQLNVQYGPRNVSIEGGGSARERETLALTCQGDANPEANITWRRKTGSEQPRWNISTSRGKSELRINSLSPDDHGLYECVVENPLGAVRLEAQLNVQYGPRNVSIEGGGSARERETLVLTCQGDANPEANITWRRETGSEQPRWNISTSRGKSELRIDSLSPDDHGLYECVVENPLGAVRLEAQLNVQLKPDQRGVILGLSVPLASFLGIGVLLYLTRKRLFKDLIQGKPLTSKNRSSKNPPNDSPQSSPC
ncbi:hemicentin-2-like [Stegostoma tigrinum]|uniref:hemicentin-2-like n=1 Tax=Stegostoma tigrinum TaxID=3053191 RepID=UPI00202AD3B5|nr:hemicentin-2-like [Stegostoma tigrinum]